MNSEACLLLCGKTYTPYCSSDPVTSRAECVGKNEGVLQSTYLPFPKKMFFQHISWQSWCESGSIFRVAILVSCPCVLQPVVLFKPSRASPFAWDHPWAHRMVPALQVSEIFLCLELGPEAPKCIYSPPPPFSFVMVGKDTFKGFLICWLLPVFPTE